MNTANISIPVIFLAFANDQVDQVNYLRGLKKERDGIRDALKLAEKAGLCQLVERSNATINNILDVFQEYQDRVAIFHYGGHANGYQLLLETLEGQHASAHSEGLVSFFAKQRGLKLIFLNGCSSQQQALDLVEAGVPAVIGTSQSINDDVATTLAIRFYKGMAVGKTIDRAWKEAVDEVKIEKGTANFRDFYWDGLETTNSPSTTQNIDRFPWEIHYKAGATAIKEWDLPEAVANPLFGLPDIPPTHYLPEKPFLFFKRYERKHAEVFFGRASFIRKLYNLVTSATAPPIILFYGQSGAGKSSLLDAGLLPRIETDYQAIYVRRDPTLGLLETVTEALEDALKQETLASPSETILVESIPAPSAQAEQLIHELLELAKVHPHYAHDLRKLANQAKADQNQKLEKVKRDGLAGLWHQVEENSGKPLILILDQVEEVFTHPHEQIQDEAKQFFELLFDLFGKRPLCPKGRLMLAFRKEFTAEIERDMHAAQLPFSKVFLTKLERPNIIEAVAGLAATEKLRNKYQLSIEPNLPVLIADDLLEDKDSPIAPVLQILLTKMWEKAMEENFEAPIFSKALYQQIKTEGLLMEDFLNQQLKKLSENHSTYVESGLVLDLLHFHTTKQRTSATQQEKDVLARYEDKAELVAQLLHELTKLCLLVPIKSGVRKLTHDTLAQIVKQKFNESITPGQRAMRILSYKMVDYEAGQDVLLDSSDLRIVKAGLSGMRNLTEKEQELIDKSQEELDSRAVMQARKDQEIVFFRGRSEEKEIESNLLRLQQVMEEEAKKKDPSGSLAIAKAAYEQYPNHPQARRMAYTFLGRQTPIKASLADFKELFQQDHAELLSAVEPGEEPTTPIFAPNEQWSLSISFPSHIEIYDSEDQLEHELNIVIRDYGTIRSLVILPDNEHFLLCTTDGLVFMYTRHGDKIMTLGDSESESRHFYSAVYEESEDVIILKTTQELLIYPLDPKQIFAPLTIRELSPMEKREFGVDWE